MGHKKAASDKKKKAGRRKAKGAAAAKSTPPQEHWKDEPEAHDYPAAADYLSLLLPPAEVRHLVVALQRAPLERRKAKDLLRASSLPLLPPTNPHVAADLAKAAHGEKLSPVLLVRGDADRDLPLVVADGYHRVCASYHLNENADIPCHLADRPTA